MWRRIQNPDSLIVTQEVGPVLPQTGQPAPSGFKFTPIEIESVQPDKGIPTPAPTLPPEQLATNTAANDPENPAKPSDGIDIKQMTDSEVDAYLRRIRNFDAIFASDIYLDPKYEHVLLKTTRHLARVESYMGHGNFNLMSFDEMLQSGRNFPRIGAFEADELNFLEEIFFANPHRYGFFGKKIVLELTEYIPKNDVAKVPDTGHFLIKGEPLNLYNKMKADVGQIILTSGVRSNVKQMHLFLAKTIEANGNLSRASRSLAPPGHSYHGVGDFDIGKIGFGARNFTADFSSTEEYKKIARLGYVDIRYPTDNLFGVRFEPWHIKIG